MRIRSLRVDHISGIETGYRISALGPGINVIHGPNGSGKSTLGRAFRALLYPAEEPSAGPVSLGAVVELGGAAEEAVEIDRAGPEIRWSAAGQPLEPARLPEHRHIGCYTIALDDLLAAQAQETELAARIARELGGGYDLDAVAESPPFRLKASHGRAEARSLDQAQAETAEITRAHRRLREEADQLAALCGERDAALSQATSAQGYEAALELLHEGLARRAVERRLQRFPVGLERLHGNEGDALDRLRSRARAAEQERSAAAPALARACAIERSAAAGGACPRAEDIAVARRLLAALADVEREREVQERERARAACTLARARADLGPGAGEPGARRPALTPSTVDTVEETLRAKQPLAAQARALAAELELLGPPPPPGQAAPLLIARAREARAAVIAWSGAQEPGPGWQPRGWLETGLLGSLALSGVAAAALLHGLWHLLLALPAGLALALACTRLRARAAAARDARQRLLGLGVPLPGRGEESARLAELDLEVDAAVSANTREQARVSLSRRLEAVRAKVARVEAELARQAERLGFHPRHLDPSASGASFDRWLHLTSRFDEAERAHDRTLADLHRLAERSRERLAVLQDHLCPLLDPRSRDLLRDPPSVDAPPGVAALEGQLDELEARHRRWSEAEVERVRAAEAMAAAEQALQAVAAEREELWAAAGLDAAHDTGSERASAAAEAEAEAELRRRLAALGDWREARRELEQARAREGQARDRLERAVSDPAVRAERLAQDEAVLEQGLAGARRRGQEAERLAEQIASTRARVDQTRAGAALESARAHEDQCRERLAERYGEALLAEAGTLLLETVEREHVGRARPAVLRSAQSLFSAFTAHRVELVYSSSRTFRAFDNEQRRTKELAQLSSGTRAQLLLAVRLAFAEELERGLEPLPLFIDEALATADAERFAAVAGSLDEIARRQHRQVIYLTAQAGDVSAWQRLGIEVNAIDLAAQRGLALPRPDWSVRRPPAVPRAPRPAEDPRHYAERLRVPAIEPWREAAAVHLFHLLRSQLGDLHRLLCLQIETVGQLASFIEGGRAGALFGPPWARMLAGRIEVLEHFLELWRSGRGKPLDVGVLAASPALTPRFAPAVAALAARCAGDAEAVLAALERGEVRKFGEKRIARLRVWLLEEGHLADRPPFDRSERLQRVLAGAHQAVGRLGVDEARELVGWLEAALAEAGAGPQPVPRGAAAGELSASAYRH